MPRERMGQLAACCLCALLIAGAALADFWRVPAADIPKDSQARRDWLFAQWEAVDAWIAGPA